MQRLNVYEYYNEEKKELDLSYKEDLSTLPRLTYEDVTSFIVPFLNDHPEIKTLNLSGNKIRDEGALALAANMTLTTLDVSKNKIRSKGARILAGNRTTFTTLRLSKNKIGLDGVIALAANTTLTTLDVSNNETGYDGAKALAANTTLTTLKMSNNEIGDDGAKILANNKKLTTLNVDRNNIGHVGAKAFAASTTLTTLDVSDNYIGYKGARALAANTKLTTLNVSNTDIGDKGAIALAASTTLTTLDVSFNDISYAGAMALAKNTILTTLQASGNRFGDIGTSALADNTTLTTLSVDANNIGHKGAIALAANKTLTTLKVDANNIGHKGAIALAANKTLTMLNVSYNDIGNKGASALAANTKLTTLNMSYNDIGNKGASALAANTTLTTLDVSNNKIRSEGIRALATNTTLTKLDVSNNNHVRNKVRDEMILNKRYNSQEEKEFTDFATAGMLTMWNPLKSRLNNLQKNIIEVYLNYLYDNLSTLTLDKQIDALKAIKRPVVSEKAIANFIEMDVWDTIQEIRNILKHPCPQNRYNGNGNAFKHEHLKGRKPITSEEKEAAETGVYKGIVYSYSSGFGSTIYKEPQGIFGLTGRNRIAPPKSSQLFLLSSELPTCNLNIKNSIVILNNQYKLEHKIGNYHSNHKLEFYYIDDKGVAKKINIDEIAVLERELNTLGLLSLLTEKSPDLISLDEKLKSIEGEKASEKFKTCILGHADLGAHEITKEDVCLYINDLVDIKLKTCFEAQGKKDISVDQKEILKGLPIGIGLNIASFFDRKTASNIAQTCTSANSLACEKRESYIQKNGKSY